MQHDGGLLFIEPQRELEVSRHEQTRIYWNLKCHYTTPKWRMKGDQLFRYHLNFAFKELK